MNKHHARKPQDQFSTGEPVRPIARFTAAANTVPELDQAARAIAHAAGIDLNHHHLAQVTPATPGDYLDQADLGGRRERSVTSWEADYEARAPLG